MCLDQRTRKAMSDVKRIAPDENVGNDELIAQLESYGDGAAQHTWSRRWMTIAADRIDKLREEVKRHRIQDFGRHNS